MRWRCGPRVTQYRMLRAGVGCRRPRPPVSGESGELVAVVLPQGGGGPQPRDGDRKRRRRRAAPSQEPPGANQQHLAVTRPGITLSVVGAAQQLAAAHRAGLERMTTGPCITAMLSLAPACVLSLMENFPDCPNSLKAPRSTPWPAESPP